ncbi:MAG TPA: hypothetical protein PLY89_09125, partial [Synergistaceae bacterium]|nr:hypothetical protein [Synergistaceae bacterium]
MKLSLAAYRRRIVAFFALVMTLLGIGGAAAFMVFFLNQGEAYLGRQSALLSRELALTFELQEMVLAGIAARESLEVEMTRDFLPEQLAFLGICSAKEGGKIIKVFTGPQLEGLAVS